MELPLPQAEANDRLEGNGDQGADDPAIGKKVLVETSRRVYTASSCHCSRARGLVASSPPRTDKGRRGL